LKKWNLFIAYVFKQSGLIKKSSYKNISLAPLVLIITLITELTLAPNVLAQTPDHLDRVKAAFIVNFIRYTTWPAASKDQKKEQLSLCLYRNNLSNPAMSAIHGKKAGGLTIQVSTVLSLTDSHSCNILYITKDSLDLFVDEIQPGLNKPILTIADLTDSELSQARLEDILISLVRKKSSIGFQINLNKSRQVGLILSSKLLKLATIVGGGSL